MPTSNPDRPAIAEAERRAVTVPGRPSVAGVQVRDDDVEPTRALHSVALLFRALAGLLLVVMVLQVASGLTSMIEISYGVLIAEALRLIIFAGLLWGAGDLADLFVKSHADLRATRILLGRLSYMLANSSRFGDGTEPDDDRPGGSPTH